MLLVFKIPHNYPSQNLGAETQNLKHEKFRTFAKILGFESRSNPFLTKSYAH